MGNWVVYLLVYVSVLLCYSLQAQENIVNLPLANRWGEKHKLFVKWKHNEAKVYFFFLIIKAKVYFFFFLYNISAFETITSWHLRLFWFSFINGKKLCFPYYSAWKLLKSLIKLHKWTLELCDVGDARKLLFNIICVCKPIVFLCFRSY